MDYKFTFDSVESFLDACRGRSDISEDDRSSRNDSTDWNGNVSFDDAVNLAKFGWKAGAQNLAKFQSNLTGNTGENTSYNWDKTGEFFDIGAVLSGSPDCWLETTSEPSNQCLEICVAASFPGIIDGQTITRRGAAIVALIDSLEASGIRVGLSFSSYSTNSFSSSEIFGRLKAPEHALDIDRVAFVLSNPAFHRRLIFSFKECQSRKYRADNGINKVGGYGKSCPKRPAALPSDAIFIGMGDSSDFESDDKARAWLQRTLAEMAPAPC